MIRSEGLSKSFGPRPAIENVSISVGEGEVFGFLGPNGAGKTTTVRILACLISSTSGKAWIGPWRVGTDDDLIRQNVGILTESPGLYDRFSARFNLDFYARLYGVPDRLRASHVEKYLRLLDLWDRRDEPVGTYSKGMKQKMAIARSIVHEPSVLFLDEPTSGLDPEAARTVRDFITELRAAGRTIFMCTHNLDEADRLCDRIAIIDRRIVAVGTPAELRQRLHGQQTVLHLAAPCGDALAALQRMSYPAAATPDGAQIIVPVSDPATQNPAIIRTAVLAGAQIRYVGEVRASLEDVYLSLLGSSALDNGG